MGDTELLEIIHEDVKSIKKTLEGDGTAHGLKTQVALNKTGIATINGRHKWIVGTLTALGISFAIAVSKAVAMKFK
jgi:hypothetical protein